MVTTLPSPRRRRVCRLLGNLFREARRLEQRRRRRYAALILVLGLVAGGGGVLAGARGSAPRPGRRPMPPLLSSLALPRSGDFLALAAVGDRVVVSGGPDGSLFPSGVTSLSNGRATGTCDAATLAIGTLRLDPVRHANCGDPSLYGQQVLAVSYLEPNSTTHGISTYGIRIAHSVRSARDGYTLGPVVMTYPQCSDCQAQWIYGAGSLWLYGTYLGGGFNAKHGLLERISEFSGRVLQRWSIPQNPRELLAVNADGLWFAPSVEGGFPEHLSASQRIRYESLYHVAPGATAPKRVLAIPGGSAYWLAAAGHSVWLEARGPGRRPQLWGLKAPHAKPEFLGSYPRGSDQGADIGEAAPTHAGDRAIGVYFVKDQEPWSPNVKGQEVIDLGADAAIQRAVVAIRPRTPIQQYSNGPPAVAAGGSFYFLDPALLNYNTGNRPPAIIGRGILYRVSPSQRSRTQHRS